MAKFSLVASYVLFALGGLAIAGALWIGIRIGAWPSAFHFIIIAIFIFIAGIALRVVWRT